jgi:ABC-type lipoprotein release transport system permease subunit
VLISIAIVFIGNAAFGAFVQSQDPGHAVSNLFVVSLLLVAAGLLLATAISLLGGALPTRRAVAIQPLDALRYE